jgi:molybdenum-dependent DNA-binding transcriptional regulator ModE
MPDALKGSVEEAAEAIGVSVNAWLVQAAQSAIGRTTEQRRGGGNRISGFARS